MDISIFLYFAIFTTFFSSTSGTVTCTIEDHNYSCTYTVVCENHAGSASNPSCDSEPYVTFVITKSQANPLTAGFFGSTNFDTRVRVIKAVDNNWSSIAPVSWRYFAKTIFVDLSNNHIKYIQNEAFRNLMVLENLNLSRNAIEDLSNKALLISDSKITNLYVLDLSYNMLSNLSTEVFSELPKLKTLYLQNNRIITFVYSKFINQYLTTLYLQNNLLTSRNTTLIGLKSIKYLDLSFNSLNTLSGYELNQLIALEHLNVSHNDLESVESDCFNQAFNLNSVDFSFNRIKSTIESIMFVNNVNLNYVDLFNNSISKIEHNAFKHNPLVYINLENNNINGDIVDGTFAGFKNITKLDLSGQNITAIRDEAFLEMKNLLHLNLSRNYISVIEKYSFVHLPVSILDVSFNHISNIDFLSVSLNNLTELYLNNNNISVIPKNAFQQQQLIRKLDISMNKIIDIEQYALPLKNLQYLNMIGNCFADTIKNNVFSPAKYLRSLDLSNLNISKIDAMAFADLPNLARLNLSYNHIESIHPNNFKGVDNMYSLDMSHNNLSDLKFDDRIPTNLKAVYLNNNKLTNVSRIFLNSSRLLYFDISHNDISDVSDIGAKILPNLTVLHLSHNKINSFNNPETNSLTTMVELGLSSNNLTDIKLSYFKELLSVDLSNNKFQYINRTFLENVNYLQSLDISRNNISDLPPGTFLNMKNLKLLNLSSNYISQLRYGSLKGLHKTELLDISKNRISVINVDVFHEATELKTLIIDYNRIKTLDMERLVLITQRKLKKLSLGGNPISCHEIVRNLKTSNLSYFSIIQVEVTSIDKIYHEDNVHGIKCGDDSIASTTLSAVTETVAAETGVSAFTIIFIWCLVITIIIIVVAVVGYMKIYKKEPLAIYRDSRIQLRNSLELNNSEYQNDLLN